ncbi:MAG: DNA polymerase III subunit epsilon [Micrococcales bacterium]|nr:MAG: DNA polymerase III subunit epsilon [Micrococcales bacterium]
MIFARGPRPDRLPAGPFRDFVAAGPPPDRCPVEELPALAVDLETTGMNPSACRMLSVGFVPLNGLSVDLSGARHFVIRQHEPVGQSAVFHGLTDDVLAGGVELDVVLDEVFTALTGRVLLAHHVPIERGCLSSAAQQRWGVKPRIRAVDTMLLQARVLGVDPEVAPPGVLRLPAARRDLGLPDYDVHEALTDALACAEVYLAQVSRLTKRGRMSLRSIRS